MISFAVYTETGRIVRSGHAATMADALIQAHEGEAVLVDVPEGTHPNQHKIVAGEVVPKPAIPYVLTGNVLSNLPSNTLALFEMETVAVMDGTLVFDGDLPGTYVLELVHPLYLTTLVEVTV